MRRGPSSEAVKQESDRSNKSHPKEYYDGWKPRDGPECGGVALNNTGDVCGACERKPRRFATGKTLVSREHCDIDEKRAEDDCRSDSENGEQNHNSFHVMSI
jgi:hypothetical protein